MDMIGIDSVDLVTASRAGLDPVKLRELARLQGVDVCSSVEDCELIARTECISLPAALDTYLDIWQRVHSDLRGS